MYCGSNRVIVKFDVFFCTFSICADESTTGAILFEGASTEEDGEAELPQQVSATSLPGVALSPGETTDARLSQSLSAGAGPPAITEEDGEVEAEPTVLGAAPSAREMDIARLSPTCSVQAGPGAITEECVHAEAPPAVLGVDSTTRGSTDASFLTSCNVREPPAAISSEDDQLEATALKVSCIESAAEIAHTESTLCEGTPPPAKKRRLITVQTFMTDALSSVAGPSGQSVASMAGPGASEASAAAGIGPEATMVPQAAWIGAEACEASQAARILLTVKQEPLSPKPSLSIDIPQHTPYRVFFDRDREREVIDLTYEISDQEMDVSDSSIEGSEDEEEVHSLVHESSVVQGRRQLKDDQDPPIDLQRLKEDDMREDVYVSPRGDYDDLVTGWVKKTLAASKAKKATETGPVPWMEPPQGMMTCSLYKHQKEGLAWLVERENKNSPIGGILADDQV